MFSKNSLFNKAYAVHIAVGLFLSFNIALLASTGLVLLFKDEVQTNFSTTAESSTKKNATSTDYLQVLQNSLQENPNTRPLAIFPDEQDPSVLKLRLGENGSTQLRGSKKLMVPTNPNAIAAPASPVFEFLLELHRELFLGSLGKIYVGIIGVFYVLLLLSGFFIYSRFTKNRKFIPTYRAQKTNRTDYHKLTGIISVGWSLLVAFTGVLLAFNGYLIKFFQLQTLKDLSAKYGTTTTSSTTIAPIDQVIDAALAAKSNASVSYISFPNTEFGLPGQFLVLINDGSAALDKATDIVVVNAINGIVTEVIALPWYLQALLYSESLHFGDFGGLTLKLIWAAFTLCSLAVVFLGISSYLKKRAKKKVRVTNGSPAQILQTEASNV